MMYRGLALIVCLKKYIYSYTYVYVYIIFSWCHITVRNTGKYFRRTESLVEEFCLLGNNSVPSSESKPIFRRKISLQCSGLESKTTQETPMKQTAYAWNGDLTNNFEFSDCIAYSDKLSAAGCTKTIS